MGSSACMKPLESKATFEGLLLPEGLFFLDPFFQTLMLKLSNLSLLLSLIEDIVRSTKKMSVQ